MQSARHRKLHMQFSRERDGIEDSKARESLQFPLQCPDSLSPSRGYVVEIMEARVGIEPTHKGFADLSLTTWVPRPGCGSIQPRECAHSNGWTRIELERETGVEPATSSLARKHSTTELLPLTHIEVYRSQEGWSTR